MPLVVYTDHNPLTFLRSMPCPNQSLMPWCVFLQAYTIWKYATWRGLIIADALSYAPLSGGHDHRWFVYLSCCVFLLSLLSSISCLHSNPYLDPQHGGRCKSGRIHDVSDRPLLCIIGITWTLFLTGQLLVSLMSPVPFVNVFKFLSSFFLCSVIVVSHVLVTLYGMLLELFSYFVSCIFCFELSLCGSFLGPLSDNISLWQEETMSDVIKVVRGG